MLRNIPFNPWDNCGFLRVIEGKARAFEGFSGAAAGKAAPNHDLSRSTGKREDPMNFQDVILSLEKYWANYGCLIVQPYDLEVGAGTFNPATTLRVLGPEPWNVAYVEPSRRPTDGRYGENPNRLQHYYQYQVILKPSPLDVQELYLDSLRALGIDPLDHDIRFVEDDWNHPRWAPGASAGRSGSMAWRLPNLPIFNRSAVWNYTLFQWNSPTASNAFPCTCNRWTTFTT